MSRVTVDEIEILFKLVIEKLKNDKRASIEFNTDEYWIITSDEWDNFKKMPKPAVGSIKEDIEYLKKAIRQGRIYTYSDLDRLATILRAISEIEAPIN